jgi:hypothetical protein
MFTRTDLEAAQSAGVLDRPTLDRLIAFLATRAPAPAVTPPRFDLSHLLWYAGALIIMGSMGLFSTLAFSMMGGMALTLTAFAYAAGFLFAGDRLWRGKDLRTPGGLLIACAVAMAPLAVFGIQEWAGWWGAGAKAGTMHDFYVWIKGGWVPMEIVTLVAAIIALRFYPFPFITFVASVMLWFLTMDLADLIAGKLSDGMYSNWPLRRAMTQWFGLALIIVAWGVDLKKRTGDFAFWLHLAGIAAFWGAVSAQSSDSEIAKAIYCAMNVGLILLSVFLSRRVYAVYGAMGVMFYLGYLANKLFKDSLLFPFALSALGLALIWVGIVIFRNRAKIEARMEALMLPSFAKLRPAHAREAMH